MTTLIIDRIEGNFAVCEREDRAMQDIDRSKIPVEAKEGDVLRIDEKTDTITIDREETARRKEALKKQMDNLWN